MVFKRNGEFVTVYLSREETYAPVSKERLFFLLRRAMFKTNFFPDATSFRVKTSSARNGGVMVTFTPVPNKRDLSEPLIFRFENLDSLYDAAEIIGKRYSLYILKSRLFFEGGYILILYPLANLSEAFYKDMAEYGLFLGASRLKEAFFIEHGDCLARENAVEKLCL